MPDVLPLLLREVVHVLDRLDHHALHGDSVVGDLQHHRCRRQGQRIPSRRCRLNGAGKGGRDRCCGAESEEAPTRQLLPGRVLQLRRSRPLVALRQQRSCDRGRQRESDNQSHARHAKKNFRGETTHGTPGFHARTPRRAARLRRDSATTPLVAGPPTAPRSYPPRCGTFSINAPEGCPHGTHTSGTAYTRGTYSRVHTQTHTNTQSTLYSRLYGQPAHSWSARWRTHTNEEGGVGEGDPGGQGGRGADVLRAVGARRASRSTR